MEKEGYYIAASLDKIEDDIRIPYAKQPRFLNELNETNQTIMKQGLISIYAQVSEDEKHL